MYEHITGGGFIDAPLPASLRAEGELMLRALVADLAAIARVRVVVMCDQRIDLADLPAKRRVVRDRAEWRTAFGALLAASDALWPIAPETDGELERLSRAALDAGRSLLNSRPEAVRVAASKRATAQALAAAGVPVIPTYAQGGAPPGAPGQWVTKPDDGCGCKEARRWDDLEAAARWIGAQAAPSRYVLQPYVPGAAASLCVLARDGATRVLSVNRQRIAVRDGRFAFLGAVVGELADDDGRYARLAERVARAIPGLWGYFGVDLVLGADGPIVVEVNPRLTTSYVGLGAALGGNPAALVLGLLGGEGDLPAAPPACRPQRVAVDVARSDA